MRLNGNGNGVYINRDNPEPEPVDGGIGIVWRGDSAGLVAPFIAEFGAVATILDTLRQISENDPAVDPAQALVLESATLICQEVVLMWAGTADVTAADLAAYQTAAADLVRSRLEPLGGRVTRSIAEYNRLRDELLAEPD